MRVRQTAALALIAVPFVVTLILLLTVQDLPNPLPSHWNVHGDVNGTMSRAAFTVMALLVTFGAVVVAIGFTRAHEDEEVRRFAATACAFAAYLIGGLSVMTLVLANGAEQAADVGLPWSALLLTLVIAFGVPALVYRIWPRPEPVPDGPPDPALPRIQLAPGERAAYVTTIRSSGFVALGIGCAALGLGLIVFSDVIVGATVIAVAAAVLALSRVTLRVDETGVRIAFGPGIRVRVPMDDIRQAAVEDIRPLAWGGWGYRIRPGRRGLILRAGPGLVLDLRSGTRFAVTVDDPERPAALLNGLLERRARRS
jgi:hypothetical protein